MHLAVASTHNNAVAFQHKLAFSQSTILIFTDYFSGLGTAIGPVFDCVCVCVRLLCLDNNFQTDK